MKEELMQQPVNEDTYINAFKTICGFDGIDEADLEREEILNAIRADIYDCETDGVIPSEQDMADVVKQALRQYQYGDSSDIDDLSKADEDLCDRFP